MTDGEDTSNNGGGQSGLVVIHTNSKADALTVYQQWAQVRRRAEIALPSTVNSTAVDTQQQELHLFFTMPKSFDRESVQVRFDEHTAARVVLRGVLFEDLTHASEDATLTEENSLRQQQQQQKYEDDVHSIRERMHAVEKQLQQNHLELAEVDDELSLGTQLFSRVCGPLTDDLPEVLDAGFWQSQLGGIEKCVSGANAVRRRLTKSRAELSAELRHLQEQLDTLELAHCESLPTSPQGRGVSVCIVLKVTEALPKAVVFVTYIVRNASWNAEYEVALDSHQRLVTLHYNAVVRAGGEKFDDVMLTLSSSDPRRHAEEPELEPWRLTRAGTDETSNMLGVQPRALIAASRRRTQTVSSPGIQRAMPTQQTAGVVNFALASRHTFRAGGATLRVPLTVLQWKADVTYVTVPSKVESVYAKATCVNESEYLLVPGNVAVMLDGNFVTSTHLKRTAPGEKLHVHFGVDTTIEVRRKLVQHHTTNKKVSLFNRDPKQRLLYSYITTLTNKKQHEALCVLLQEQIPKSNEENLIVRLIEPKDYSAGTEGGQHNTLEVDGVVERQVQLDPGKSVTLPFSFEVEAPTEARITGLGDPFSSP